jgi:hypothetical protein
MGMGMGMCEVQRRYAEGVDNAAAGIVSQARARELRPRGGRGASAASRAD